MPCRVFLQMGLTSGVTIWEKVFRKNQWGDMQRLGTKTHTPGVYLQNQGNY